MFTITTYLSSIFGVYFTFILKRKFEINTVRASSITIVCACVIEFMLTKGFPVQTAFSKLSYPACSGSFCGMSSSKLIKNDFWAIACGLLNAWIYTAAAPVFKGIGGGMGTSACVAVLACYGIMIVSDAIYKRLVIR